MFQQYCKQLSRDLHRLLGFDVFADVVLSVETVDDDGGWFVEPTPGQSVEKC